MNSFEPIAPALGTETGEAASTDRASALTIALFGLVNAGKSSLINALAGRPVREVGPTSGTTEAVETEPWGTVDTTTGPVPILLLDTPGLEEIGDRSRDSAAREAARRADFIVFVTEEDLTAAALEAIQWLHAWGKPLFVALNKSDQHDPDTLDTIVHSLRSRLASILEPNRVFPVAAAPIVRERVTEDSGHVTTRSTRAAPEIEPLRRAMAEVLDAATDLRCLREASDQVEDFVQKRETELLRRRERAERVADETAVGLATALAINPVPIFDLLTAPTGIAILVRRLSSVYEIRLNPGEVQRLSSDLLRHGRAVMWGSLAGAGAGGLLKLMPGLGHLAGAIAQGSCAGLFAHVLGRSLIQYFEHGCDWGEAGIRGMLDRVAATTDRVAVTRNLVAELKARLARRENSSTESRNRRWFSRREQGPAK